MYVDSGETLPPRRPLQLWGHDPHDMTAGRERLRQTLCLALGSAIGGGRVAITDHENRWATHDSGRERANTNWLQPCPPPQVRSRARWNPRARQKSKTCSGFPTWNGYPPTQS